MQTWKKFVPAKEETSDKKSDKKDTSDKKSDKKDTSDKKESSSSSSKSNDSSEKPRKGTNKGNNGFYEYDGTVLFEDEQCRKRDGYSEKLPKRNTDGVTLIFSGSVFLKKFKKIVSDLEKFTTIRLPVQWWLIKYDYRIFGFNLKYVAITIKMVIAKVG